MNRVVTSPDIAPAAARYAPAVVSLPGSSMLHTAGIVPVSPDGTVPDGVDAQAEVVWANIAALLGEAGFETADIVTVTTYVVPGQDLDAVMAARDRFMGEHLAASTLVVVAALVRPEWKVEIAVVAARSTGYG